MPPHDPTVTLRALPAGFITSCQPVRGGPFDEPALVARFAQAAQHGGSAAVRVESLADVAAVRRAVTLPIVGLVKRGEPGVAVHITPALTDVGELVDAGADVVAFDATHRHDASHVPAMITTIHDRGATALADIATYQEGIDAWRAGADFVATTLSGYTPDSPQLETPDLDLVRRLADAGVRVVAEGRITTPSQAAEAIAQGAWAVTVGTAITRPERIVEAFAAAVDTAWKARTDA